MDYGVIDCDFHPGPVSDVVSILERYLTRQQVERLKWIGVGQGAGAALGSMLGRARHFSDSPTSNIYRAPDGGPPATDIDFVRESYLEPQNIDATILAPMAAALVDTWTYAEEAAWFVSALNQHYLDEWVDADQRFSLAATLSPHAIDLAVDEIHRVGSRDGVAAVFLPVLNELFGSRVFWPIWEAACEYQLPILIHPSSQDDFIGNATRAGGHPIHHAERYSTLAEFAMSHLASMMYEGTFERFPELKLVVVEYGWPWVPAFLWRADAGWKAARRAHPYMKKSPTEYVLSSVRFTSQPTLEVPAKHLDTMLELMHAETTLLFGCDYPHWDSEQPWQVFTKVKEPLRRRIFRDNALEFFGSRLRVPTVVESR